MPEIHKFHDSLYDPQVETALSFTEQNLGLQVTPPERIAIVHPNQVADMRRALGASDSYRGGYNPDTDEVVVLAERNNPDAFYARNADLDNTKAAVHELSHSGTYRNDQHAFYTEGVAGIGEYKFLEAVRKTPQHNLQPAADFLLKRAGVELWLPGSFRAYESSDGNANTSQAMVALRGLSYGTTLQRKNAANIIRGNMPGSYEPYRQMKAALDTVKPGLSHEVTTFPETTDGIIQASAMVEQEIRDQGYKLPDPQQVLADHQRLIS